MSDVAQPARGPVAAARSRLSIGTLMFLLVSVVLLPAAAVAAWFLGSHLDHVRTAAEAEVKLLAHGTAAALQLTLDDQRALMRRLAERPHVRALDPDNFDPGVAEYLRLHPEYNNLGVRDREARLVFSGRPGTVTSADRLREFPWFKEGIASGRFLAGDAFEGTLSKRWVTVLTHPVFDERGAVIGLMNLSLDLLTLNQRVLGAVRPDAIVAVTDRQDRYLLRSTEPEAWLGKPGPTQVVQDTRGQREGFLSATGPDGVTRLYAFITMAGTGWRVVAGLPQDLVFASYRDLLARSVAIGVGILLLALLAAWRVSRSIVRPVQGLSDAAARIAGGDADARAPEAGPPEIASVARQFNQMVEARARSDAALRDSESSLAITLQSIGDAVIATNVAGHITRMNSAAERLTGWRLADAVGQPLAEVMRIVHSVTRQPAADPVPEVLRSGSVVELAGHTVLLARDGKEYQIADSAAPIRDAAGRTRGVVVVFSDVTERYRAEQALRANAEMLRLRDRALAEISQGVMMTDTRSCITYVNPGFERLTGYAESETLGRTAKFLQGPDTSAATMAEIARAVRAGEGFHGEILNYRKDGSLMWLALDISPLRDELGALTGYVGAQRDITERKQAEAARRDLESQLRESQKMESVGTLAGGIAHDFNNILGAILGNLVLLRDEVGAVPAARQCLEQISRASLRARDLVQQILTFSRRQPQVLVVQPLQPILQETLALLRAGMPAMVELDVALAGTPLYVNADATQIQQVLMNLGTNAWHALQGNTGHIGVGVDERQLDAAAGQALGGLPPGRYAHLWVSDDGIGMDEATRQRMFEPFFTTKPVGGGTGLGLSVVHGIVMAHRGAIHVASTSGKGTTFDLYFPICDPPAAGAAVPSAARPVHGHGERVLYVDDDEVVRLVVERLLHRAGWHATTAPTVAAALQELTAAQAPFDVVVTDFNMPGLSGLDLAAEVARLRPGLPVVITSGYMSEELLRGAERLGVHHLLQKQDLFETLTPLVQRVLAERRVAQVE